MDAEDPNSAAPGSRAKRILVAEDGQPFRDALIRILGSAGYEVEAVPDGASALERLAEGSRGRFDLLLADVLMPQLSGVDLVDRVRSEFHDPPKVIFMSGEIQPALNDAPGTIGGDTILAKPFDADQLLAAVRAILA